MDQRTTTTKPGTQSHDDEFPLYEPAARSSVQDSNLVVAPPAQTVAPVASARPSRKGLMMVLPAIAGGVAVVGVLVVGPRVFWGGVTATASADFSGQTISKVIIQAERGEVRITDGEGPTQVEVSSRCDNPDPGEVVDGVLTVRSSCDRSTDLTLNVPDGTEIEIRSDRAEVVGRDLTARRVTINSDRGSIQLDFDSAPEAVTINSDRSKVDLTLPRGEGANGYRYDIRSDRGDRDVPADSGSRPILVRTDRGDIEIDER